MTVRSPSYAPAREDVVRAPTRFDQKIGGTVHLALGRSYPETGGKNAAALH
jgi:aminopeptidase